MQADTRTKERVSRRGCRFFPTKPSFIQRDDTISLRKSRASRSTDAGLMSVENSFKRKERTCTYVRTYVRMYIRVCVSVCIYVCMCLYIVTIIVGTRTFLTIFLLFLSGIQQRGKEDNLKCGIIIDRIYVWLRTLYFKRENKLFIQRRASPRIDF